MKFDKKRLLKNIENLLKERNMKISELEKKIYVSSGYFSRLRKDDGATSPKVDTISDIADVFGVSIDYLLYGEDVATETSNVSKVCKFIKKLQEDSGQGNVVWNKGKIKDHYFVEQLYENKLIFLVDLENRTIIEPQREKCRYIDGRNEYLWETRDVVLYSRGFEDGCKKVVRLLGKYYSGKMPGGAEIILLETEDEGMRGWDVYIITRDDDSYSGKKSIGIYHTSPDERPLLMKYTQDLIRCIERKNEDLYIGLELKSLIDDYLNGITTIKYSQLGEELTEEEIAELEALEDRPIVYDEDCPEMTEEMLKQFKRVKRINVSGNESSVKNK